MPAPADLRVTAVVTPSESFSGERALVQWTVQNTGAAVWSGDQSGLWAAGLFVVVVATGLWTTAVMLPFELRRRRRLREDLEPMPPTPWPAPPGAQPRPR